MPTEKSPSKASCRCSTSPGGLALPRSPSRPKRSRRRLREAVVLVLWRLVADSRRGSFRRRVVALPRGRIRSRGRAVDRRGEPGRESPGAARAQAGADSPPDAAAHSPPDTTSRGRCAGRESANSDSRTHTNLDADPEAVRDSGRHAPRDSAPAAVRDSPPDSDGGGPREIRHPVLRGPGKFPASIFAQSRAGVSSVRQGGPAARHGHVAGGNRREGPPRQRAGLAKLRFWRPGCSGCPRGAAVAVQAGHPCRHGCFDADSSAGRLPTQRRVTRREAARRKSARISPSQPAWRD